MLGRHIFGYVPSMIVTALMSFATVSLYTSWMSRAEYGRYSLLVNVLTLLVGVSFFWLQSASSRLLPEAIEAKKEDRLFSTLYCLFGLCAIGMTLVGVTFASTVTIADWKITAWFAPPLAIIRALLNLNESIHRNAHNIRRYNIIETGQSFIGLSVSMVLIVVLSMGASGAAIGSLLGLSVMALFDWSVLAQFSFSKFDKTLFSEIVYFGSPFIVTFGLSFVLSGSDRFLIEHFLGPDDVGIYSAGYAFPDRIGQNLFMLVATASFPLLIQRLEKEGVEAARQQSYINGVAVLAISIPACAGMLLVSRQLAAALIGKDFREGALAVMPWIAVATILNGIAAHHFDHAFHLAKRTRLYFLVLGPAAVLNFFGNLYAIPRFGIIGAAYTTLAAYALYLTLSICVGRRVFKIKFPFKAAGQIILSTLIMSVVLLAFPFSETMIGLIEMIGIGAICYALSILAFDIPETKALFARGGPDRQMSAARTEGQSYVYEFVSKPQAIRSLFQEWADLWKSSSRGNIFGRPHWFALWSDHLGAFKKTKTLIAIARTHDGTLAGLIPLSLRRNRGLRVLEWAGHEVFDYGDLLVADGFNAAHLWRFVIDSKSFDLLLLKDVHERSNAYRSLADFAQSRGATQAFRLPLDFPVSHNWLDSQSRKLRGDLRRKTEKLATLGPVAFHQVDFEGAFPGVVVEAVMNQKLRWLQDRHMQSVFTQGDMRSFLRALAQQAFYDKELYLAWLTSADTIVACHFGFMRNGILSLYHTSFDLSFSAYSPGNLMMAQTIQNAIESGASEIDFMRGEETYKQRFSDGARSLTTFVASGTWRGRIAIAVDEYIRRRKTEKHSPKPEAEMVQPDQ